MNPNVYLPLNVGQLFDLVGQLPKKQKQQMIDLLLEEDIAVSEQQKQLVRDRIKKYNAHPEKLIPEQEAWNIINANS
jgi:hypothetical protein